MAKITIRTVFTDVLRRRLRRETTLRPAEAVARSRSIAARSSVTADDIVQVIDQERRRRSSC